MTLAELTKGIDQEKITREALALYETVKSKYEPEHIGKFLAIDPTTKEMYMGETNIEAIMPARKAHPKTVFYLKRIGFDYTEFLANSFIIKQ